jgi:hypothetical protein
MLVGSDDESDGMLSGAFGADYNLVENVTLTARNVLLIKG